MASLPAMKSLVASGIRMDILGLLIGMALGAGIAGGIEVCRTISTEITGHAQYEHMGKPRTVESVTRADALEKFHQIVRASWMLGGACLTASTLAGITGFLIARKLED